MDNIWKGSSIYISEKSAPKPKGNVNDEDDDDDEIPNLPNMSTVRTKMSPMKPQPDKDCHII